MAKRLATTLQSHGAAISAHSMATESQRLVFATARLSLFLNHPRRSCNIDECGKFRPCARQAIIQNPTMVGIMIRRVLLALVTAALVIISSEVRPSTRIQAQVGAGFGAQRAPSIDVDRLDRLYLLMSVATKTAEAHTPGSQIFFTMSRDGGQTWDNLPFTRNLSNSDGEAFGPSVAISKTGKPLPYVTYHDNFSGTTQAYLLRTKKKTKFKKPLNITPHEGGAFRPRVALDPDESVNVVWGDFSLGRRQVMFERSTDLGNTFAEAINISNSPGDAFDPDLAIAPVASSPAGFAIYVVWEDKSEGVSAIMFSRSMDAGETFSIPAKVSRGPGAGTEADVAVDGAGRIHVVWVDTTPGDPEAFYARSTDGGDTFSEPVNISGVRGAEVHKTTVAAFENKVYLAYNEDAKARQVFVAASDNGGSSFGDPVQVSTANPNIGRAHSAAMVVDSNGTLHIVWIDSSILGNDEGLLFYSSSNNGKSFISKKMILAFVQSPG